MMAGNIVKWWKHKILGGYKQFSVQECATDSEELIFNQVRASSSCSAPPDLLLVSDRENNLPIRPEIGNDINASTPPPSSCANTCPIATINNNTREHQQFHDHSASLYATCKDSNGKHQSKTIGNRQLHTELPQQQSFDNEGTGRLENQQNNISTRHSHRHQQRSEEHIRLEEFTCDVSVEGGKSSQPLQFSFTFYDLDGHHGKITKDDIVGIVYTIYESIGKSVVVPHSGSKTINVRLTVSPDDTSKSSKATKKTANSFMVEQQNASGQKTNGNTSARRLHRYRPRKLIKSEDEDDDSNSEKERDIITAKTSNSANHVITSKNNPLNSKSKGEQKYCMVPSQIAQTTNPEDGIYDQLKKCDAETCRECEIRNAVISPTHYKTAENEVHMKNIAATRIKLHRKSRKQKFHQDCSQTRQRSLSVGNETCWSNRHLQKPMQQQPCVADQCMNNSDVLDGVQLRNQQKNTPNIQKRNSSECWKSALNRNDLISIIRESMEKNRLCFQLNGKPQANVTPFLQQSPRHRLQTVKQSQHQQTRRKTKIPMLIANHNNRSAGFSNNNEFSGNEHQNSNSIYHLQPHGPVFHQQMSMNTTSHSAIPMHNNSNSYTTGQHSKMNLCGYDSFLHATICGGGLSQTSPTQSSSINHGNNPNAILNSNQTQHQPIGTATIQPILSGKPMGLSLGSNNVKSSKILRTGSHSQTYHGSFPSPNSPQYHGYQRLPSGTKHNILEQSAEKPQHEISEKVRPSQMQNYELYAKLTEKLQRASLATANKENIQRRYKHRLHYRRSDSTANMHEDSSCTQNVGAGKVNTDYTALIPFCEDAEFQNLIAQTSDDETHSQQDIVVTENNENCDTSVNGTTNSRNVAEGTLVDLDDVGMETPTNATANSNILATSQKVSLPHIDNDEEIDDELDEDDLANLDEIPLNESERNSPISNDGIESTVANTNGANTSATSSLIHRYVHEHIHHHYHHFEEKEE
ncbi:NKD inhibitor of WNT signaling pathway naked cuticle [Haematobia irritans]|uniref:NKD inhibitor of WNT signaling pathway naked cuticle n=1 Tax=Haematobia irritans TaxID=7368 RepID=UPI003F5004A5